MKKRVLVFTTSLAILLLAVSGMLFVITTVEDEHDASVNVQIEDTQTPLAIIANEGVYKYCPTSVNGTVLYCSNSDTPGQVKDGIYLDGQKVLSTTKGAWDSVQVCDPSVIAGDFSYNGSSYTYLMAYLGCATYDCTANEVGFAVSNDLRNWIKTGRVVSAVRDGAWGVGQPSLINYDGSIYLFYTSGTRAETTTYVEKLNCADLGNVERLGKQKITCSYDFISNADFAYDNGTLYMTCDTHPFPNGKLDFISAVQSVYSAPWEGNIESLGNMNWERIAGIGSETTGHNRNHNGCFYRDEYGRLLGRTIYVTTADEIGSWSDNLYTYRFAIYGF